MARSGLALGPAGWLLSVMIVWDYSMKPSMAVVLTALALTACTGQATQPVASFQSDDESLDCAAIYAEISSNSRRIEELGRDGTEARTLQDRQSHLATLSAQRHCRGGQQSPTALTPPKHN
jgi:hypothetical protein